MYIYIYKCSKQQHLGVIRPCVSASTENEAHGLIFLYRQPFSPRDKKENINKSSGGGEERQQAAQERSVLLIYKRKKQLP